MIIDEGKHYLITTSDWFFAPDGEMYKAVWGKVKLSKTEDTLGFTPNRPSTNWFAIVGDGENSVIVAGCQIHYLVQCDKKPKEKAGVYKRADNTSEYKENNIWFTE